MLWAWSLCGGGNVFLIPMLLQTDLLCQLDSEIIHPLSATQRRNCFSHGDEAESNLTFIITCFDGYNLTCPNDALCFTPDTPIACPLPARV